MNDDLFCSQCGCEILTPDDIGRIETKISSWPIVVGVKLSFDYYRQFEETEIICTSCIEEMEEAVEASLTEADFLFDQIQIP